MTFAAAYYETPHRLSIKFPHYLEIYQRHLSRFQGEVIGALEIGIGTGGFLQVLRTYLGPQAMIYGLDVSVGFLSGEAPGITIIPGAQQDAGVLDQVRRLAPKLSIIIDDASHWPEHQRVSFEALFAHLQTPGVYLIEDTQYSYSRKYAGYKHPTSFMEYVKDRCDDLNAFLVDPPEDLLPGEFTRTAHSIHVYPNLVVIEKGVQDLRSPVHVGQRDAA